ncbi:DUF4365 domain-containing protein [Geothrix fermentans]|uniref:DUF4365 domain-containing protein n=1 Tax=Geothrix fermentans TaxID=44676 RepID=UPI0009FD0A4A|nr:DUF4365 domain-containing protein [Geothrix fermentans]
MITEPHSMEMLNRAYVHALASRVRVNLGPIQEDVYDYGIDGRFSLLTMMGGRPVPTGCELHYQLKSTRKWRDTGPFIEYKITRQAFNKMAHQNSLHFSQIILLLYCLPPDSDAWTSFDESQLVMRKCCYWYFVGETSLASNKGFHRLQIPKENLVTPESLSILLGKVKRREALT